MIDVARADPHQISGDGYWPLKVAAEDGDVPRIDWLLDHGAGVDRSSTGGTALHTAVEFDEPDAVRRLLDAGADVDRQDVDGDTPLFFARSVGVARLLLESGADPTIGDDCGTVPADSSHVDSAVRDLLRSWRPPPRSPD